MPATPRDPLSRPSRRRPAGGLASFLPALVLAALLAACATPTEAPPGPWAANGGGEPKLGLDSFTARDGLTLPLRAWLPEGEPSAVFLAIHGFNDYSKAFDAPGLALSQRGMAVYAHDQRGFGAAPHRGLWPGAGILGRDITDLARLLRERHPGRPLYLIGESMGGAVLMAAVTAEEPPSYDGLIFSSPAVWARDTMPFYQTWLLWLAVRTVPDMTVTGGGFKIQASDNIPMLIGLGRDPLFIKATRVDALYGLTNLMDRAYDSARHLPGPALLLYGKRDQVVPKAPTLEVWRRLPSKNNGPAGQRLALYDDGWHMLLRDLSSEQVLADILSWIEDPAAPLPSGADDNAISYLKQSETVTPLERFEP